QGIGRIAGGDRHIPAQAECVMLIHPGIVARLGAAGTGHTLELRSRKWVESPAFRTVLPRRRRSVERAFALAPVEAGEMPARERCPDNAVAVDVHPARRVSLNG